MASTPGPWHVTGSKKAQAATTTDCDLGVCAPSGPVASIDPYNHSPAENAANARLLAAAPETAAQRDELLAVVRDFVAMYSGHLAQNPHGPCPANCNVCRGRAAIARAEVTP